MSQCDQDLSGLGVNVVRDSQPHYHVDLVSVDLQFVLATSPARVYDSVRLLYVDAVGCSWGSDIAQRRVREDES